MTDHCTRSIVMLEERWETGDDDPDDDWDDEDDGTIPCQYCGEEMLEDSPRCTACGQYQSAEDRPPQQKPAWMIVGIVVALVIALAWAAGW